MNEPVLTYRGKTNLDFDMHLDVGTDFEFGTGEPNFDTTDIPGVSKTLLEFNGSYKSFSQKFTFYAVHKDVTADEAKRRITEWLLKDPDYHRMELSMRPDYYMEASTNSNSLIKFPAYNKRYAKVELTFMIAPFMYLKSGTNAIEIPKTQILSLNNQEQFESYPLIHITGNEGVTITINNSEFILNEIDDEIYIDSDPTVSMVYKDKSINGSRNRLAIFPDHNFPVLNPGLNTISITGDYTSATIIPRWRTLC